MVGNIETGLNLHRENLLHFSGEVDSMKMNSISGEIEAFMKEKNISKCGANLSITNSVRTENGKQILDIELFIPVNSEFDETDNFDFIKEIRLENAIKVRVDGSPVQMQSAVQQINDYIISYNLAVTSPLFVETINDGAGGVNIDDIVTDMFIGVKQNN